MTSCSPTARSSGQSCQLVTASTTTVKTSTPGLPATTPGLSATTLAVTMSTSVVTTTPLAVTASTPVVTASKLAVTTSTPVVTTPTPHQTRTALPSSSTKSPCRSHRDSQTDPSRCERKKKQTMTCLPRAPLQTRRPQAPCGLTLASTAIATGEPNEVQSSALL